MSDNKKPVVLNEKTIKDLDDRLGEGNWSYSVAGEKQHFIVTGCPLEKLDLLINASMSKDVQSMRACVRACLASDPTEFEAAILKKPALIIKLFEKVAVLSNVELDEAKKY